MRDDCLFLFIGCGKEFHPTYMGDLYIQQQHWDGVMEAIRREIDDNNCRPKLFCCFPVGSVQTSETDWIVKYIRRCYVRPGQIISEQYEMELPDLLEYMKVICYKKPEEEAIDV